MEPFKGAGWICCRTAGSFGEPGDLGIRPRAENSGTGEFQEETFRLVQFH